MDKRILLLNTVVGAIQLIPAKSRTCQQRATLALAQKELALLQQFRARFVMLEIAMSQLLAA